MKFISLKLQCSNKLRDSATAVTATVIYTSVQAAGRVGGGTAHKPQAEPLGRGHARTDASLGTGRFDRSTFRTETRRDPRTTPGLILTGSDHCGVQPFSVCNRTHAEPVWFRLTHQLRSQSQSQTSASHRLEVHVRGEEMSEDHPGDSGLMCEVLPKKGI